MIQNSEGLSSMSPSLLQKDVERSGEEVSEVPLSEEEQEESRSEKSWWQRLWHWGAQRFRFRCPPSLRADLESALARSEAEGTDAIFSSEERMLLKNILRLREIRIEDVMVPRVDIQAVDDAILLGKLMLLFRESGHSRMPVYRESLDDPRGMIHIRDTLAFLLEQAGAPLPDSKEEEDFSPAVEEALALDLRRIDLNIPLKETPLIRPLLFVPPSMPATALMAKMQATRVQMALVIDEYGGTEGLVSLEDLVETVVGDIEDEHDETEELRVVLAEAGVWIADARVMLEQLQDAIGNSFSFGALEEEVDTLGGFLFSLVGRVPVRGEVITDPALPDYEFNILEADPRRVRKVRIFKRRVKQYIPPSG